MSASIRWRWLYVNETCAKQISRFPIKGDTLGQRQTVHAFGAGEFPDGFAFDCEGGVWVACVNANRVIRIETIETNGRRSLILDGSLPELIAEGEAFFAADQGGRHHVELGARPPCRAGGTVPFKEHRQRRLRGRRSQDQLSRQSGRRPDPDHSLTDRRRRTGAVALLAKTRFSTLGTPAAPAAARRPRAPKHAGGTGL
jgi:SMP-30/Gluconolactonase/LRE-like region